MTHKTLKPNLEEDGKNLMV